MGVVYEALTGSGRDLGVVFPAISNNIDVAAISCLKVKNIRGVWHAEPGMKVDELLVCLNCCILSFSVVRGRILSLVRL